MSDCAIGLNINRKTCTEWIHPVHLYVSLNLNLKVHLRKFASVCALSDWCLCKIVQFFWNPFFLYFFLLCTHNLSYRLELFFVVNFRILKRDNERDWAKQLRATTQHFASAYTKTNSWILVYSISYHLALTFIACMRDSWMQIHSRACATHHHTRASCILHTQTIISSFPFVCSNLFACNGMGIRERNRSIGKRLANLTKITRSKLCLRLLLHCTELMLLLLWMVWHGKHCAHRLMN